MNEGLKGVAKFTLGFLIRLYEKAGFRVRKYEQMYKLETEGTLEGKAKEAWIGSYYGDNRVSVSRRADRLASEIFKLRPKTILEIGCGFGYFLDRMQTLTKADCTGIDMQSNAIDLGKERFPKLRLIVANCLNYNPKKVYDVIFTSSFFSYTNKEVTEQCIKRYAKTAKYFVICEVMAKNLNNQQYFETRISNRHHDYWGMLRAAGFDIVSEMKLDRSDPRTIIVAKRTV